MWSMIGVVSLLLLVFFAAALSASPSLPPSLGALVPDERRAEVEQILANPTFVRRLDFQVLADVRVYTFLLDHPDLNATLARALGIAPYEIVNIGPGQYRGDDGGGNVGTVEVFSANGHVRAFLESGVSPGWWFGDIGGRVVALVVFSPEEEGVRGTVTVWACIDQGVVDRLLRVLKPMLGGFLTGSSGSNSASPPGWPRPRRSTLSTCAPCSRKARGDRWRSSKHSAGWPAAGDLMPLRLVIIQGKAQGTRERTPSVPPRLHSAP